MTLTTSLNLVVSLMGLAMALVVFDRRTRQADTLLTATLAVIAVGSAAIALQHATSSDAAIDVLERIEYFAGALLGPLLLFYTRGHASRRDWPHGLAAVLAVVFLPPIRLLMLHQFAYTAASYLSWRSTRDDRTPKWSATLLLLFTTVHVSQLVRLTFNHVDWLRNIVPTSVSVAILAFAVVGFQAAFPRTAARYARSARVDRPEDQLAVIARRIREERLFARCELSLDMLATELQMRPHQLSQLLNEYAGRSFHDFVAAFRLEDFCRQLADPAHDRFTIEAIAETSGFASRSGFYAAFRKKTGMTPVQYRKAARALSTPAG